MLKTYLILPLLFTYMGIVCTKHYLTFLKIFAIHSSYCFLFSEFDGILVKCWWDKKNKEWYLVGVLLVVFTVVPCDAKETNHISFQRQFGSLVLGMGKKTWKHLWPNMKLSLDMSCSRCFGSHQILHYLYKHKHVHLQSLFSKTYFICVMFNAI